ncbi:hypothetical protein L3Q82_025405, partial [Scortum barcoo]
MRVLEGIWEFAQPVHMCFVDLEKAFDRVPRGILWGVLRKYGVRGPLLRAVRSLYDQSRSISRHSIVSMVRKELSRKAKLLIYQSISAPTLTYGHELWSLLLLHIERSQLRWLGHLFRMPPGHLPREVFQACPTGRRPSGKTQDTLERLCLSAGLGTPQSPPRKSWRSGVSEVWASLLRLLP